MRIEAVITCVNYADFLAETLPHNRAIFDSTVVVTAPEDRETRRVCEYWHVRCLPTDVFESRWGKFAKGAAINVGLGELDKSDWVLHLDADIMFPPMTRHFLEQAELDTQHLYGFDRHIVHGHDAWRRFLAMPQLQHENGAWIHIDKFPLGTRLNAGGWVAPGYAQLWHPQGSGITRYPDAHQTAARTDVQFARQWPRGKRALIPEIVLYHLESDDAANGANWHGRTTAQFGAQGELRPAVSAAKPWNRPETEEQEPY